MKPAKQPQAPEPLPGVDVNDEVYVHHASGPCAGKVVAHGAHGVTLDLDGKHHKVRWDKVLGHKKRAAQEYRVVDEGEDGMIVEDARGQRRFMGISPEAREEQMVMKSLDGGSRLLLFVKGEGQGKPMANRPGLSKKQITDKTGRQQTKWVRTQQDAPAQRKPGAGDEAGAGNGYGTHNLQTGDKVQFKAGDFEGAGEIVGEPGKDGAHVKDESGRVHQVHWNEITGKHGDEAGTGDKADGPLFSEDDLAKLPDKTNQPYGTWDELAEHGAKALEEFREKLGEIAQVMGLQSGKKPDAITPEEWHNDTGFLFIAPLKGEARAKEKVEADYDGDWSQLRDIVRATISVPNMTNIKQALGHLKDAGIEIAQKPKDKFAKPTNEGYRDLMAIVRLPGGMLAELQLHVKEMTLAKEEGHKHYDITRKLEAKYREKEPSDKWSDEDHTAFYDALKAQKEIYGAAWGKVTGGAKSASEDDKQQAPAQPLQKSRDSSKMIMWFRRAS